MNSKITIEKLVALGLTEYKARHLINFAQNESLSLQKAYYESYCRIFRADMALLSIFLFSLLVFLLVTIVMDFLYCFSWRYYMG